MRHPYNMARSRQAGKDVAVRIFWDESEWRAVVRAAILEQARDPNLGDYDAAERAQKKALPINRQRPFYSEAGNPQYRLRNGLAEYFAQMRAEARAQAAQEVAADGVSIDSVHEPQAAVGPENSPTLADLGSWQAAFPTAPEPSTDDAAPSSSEPSTTEKRKVVFWNAEEKLKIARKSRELMFGFEGMKPLEAIRKAIEYELPEDRQRSILTFGEVKWIDDMWREIQRADEQAALAHEQAEAEAREREERARAIAAQAIAENEAREREQAVHAVAEAQEQEIERRVAERVAGMTFEGLIRAFANKAVQAVMSEIGVSLYADIETQIEGLFAKVAARHDNAHDEAIIARPVHRPRILVCGLINQQIDDIKQAFGDLIDFTFAKHRDEGGSKSHEQFQHKDAVVVMADWGGARFKREAKAVGVPVVHVKGSVSNLKKWLAGYLDSAPSAQHVNGAIGMNGANGVH